MRQMYQPFGNAPVRRTNSHLSIFPGFRSHAARQSLSYDTGSLGHALRRRDDNDFCRYLKTSNSATVAAENTHFVADLPIDPRHEVIFVTDNAGRSNPGCGAVPVILSVRRRIER